MGAESSKKELYHPLGNKIKSALFWASVSKIASQVINWGMTLVVIRILSPNDYGLMAMAMIFISFLFLFNELGLAQAVIQTNQINDSQLKQIFGIVLLLHLVFFVIIYFGAPFIAILFAMDELSPVVKTLSLMFLLSAFTIIPRSLLERELEFHWIAVVDLVANLIGGFATLVLALCGFKVWALVYGSMSIMLIRVLMYNRYKPFFKWPQFRINGIGEHLRFGGAISVERFLWYFYSQADTFIVGKVLGADSLGLYSVGKELASLPAQKLSPIVNQVMLPAFARMQNELSQVRSSILTSISNISIFAFPTFFGISAVSTDLIETFLGNKWAETTVVVSTLALIAPFGMLSAMILTGLKGIGRVDISLKNILTASIIFPLAFIVGVQWEILGICVAWVSLYPVYFIITVTRSVQMIGTSLLEIISRILWPLVASTFMLLGVKTACIILHKNGWSAGPVRLGLLIIAGITIFVGIMIMVDRGEIIRLWTQLNKQAKTAS